jgi:hypothetical protein
MVENEWECWRRRELVVWVEAVSRAEPYLWVEGCAVNDSVTARRVCPLDHCARMRVTLAGSAFRKCTTRLLCDLHIAGPGG